MLTTSEAFPLATALRETFRKGYTFSLLRRDLVSGLAVSLVALPLAMALSIAVGLPPQHGIYTAIVAGLIAALFGGSKVQVSGPTAAFVVIVAPIVSEFGLHGLIWCQIMAGFILLILGFAKLGRYIHYVPYPVTTGFTAGIAVVIATMGLNDFLGLGLRDLKGGFLEKTSVIFSHIDSFQPFDTSVGVISFLAMILSARLSKKIPAQVVGILVGLLYASILRHYGYIVSTIGNHFTYDLQGLVGHGIPHYLPQFQIPHFDSGYLLTLPFFSEWKSLLMPSLVIAMLAALESLLSATVADHMTGNRHNPNSELNGIGLANIASGFVAGIPATGAIARTTTGINAGAVSPVSAIIHSLLIMLYVVVLTPFINDIPMAALSALLMMTAYRMSHIHEVILAFKHHRGSDLTVLLVCFFLTVFVDMVAGVIVGFLVAALLFMKRIANVTQIEVESGTITIDGEDNPIQLPDHVMLFRIDGPLFFGTVEKAFEQYQFIHSHIRTIIIDIERVPLIDMSGIIALKAMLQKLIGDECQIILCGNIDTTKRILVQMATPQFLPYITHLGSVEDAVNSVR